MARKVISTGNILALLCLRCTVPPASMTDTPCADGNTTVIMRGREIDTEVAIQLNNAAKFKLHFQ